MSDIINSVKEEILRLAGKQAAAQVGKAQQVAAHYRSEAIELRRLVKQQEKEIKYLKKQVPVEQPEDAQLEGVRFSAKSVKSQRRRLGLSCEQYGRLIGVSTLTIQNWESGKSRPRRQQLLVLVAVRNIGKRAALAKLAELDR